MSKSKVTRTRYSPEQKARVVELRLTGMPFKQIAEETGISEAMVKKFIRQAGVTVSSEVRSKNAVNKTFFEEDVERVRHLIEDRGMLRKDVAAELGLSKNSVQSIIQKNNIKIPREKLKRAKRTYTDEDRRAVVSLRLEGLKLEEIETRTGLSYETVRYMLAQEGVTLTPEQRLNNTKRLLTTGHKEAIRAGRLDGDPVHKIATAVGLSVPVVKRTIRTERLPLAPEIRNQNATDGKLKKHGADTWEEHFQNVAKEKGGEFLGPYVDTKTLAWWRCGAGHEFKGSPAGISAANGWWCARCSRTGPSRAQQEIYDWVRSIIPHEEVILDDWSALRSKELDIYVPSKKFAIEFNGLYWHSSAVENYKRGHHLSKSLLCRENGTRLLAVFEDEWADEQKRELIKAMIRWRLGVFEGPKLNARSLEARRLSKNYEFDWFFDRNHIDGQAKASFAYGLFLGDRMAACMSFRNPNAELEIARFAIDYDYSVRGAAGKLLAQVPGRLMTYSNNRLSDGDVYETLGFELVKEMPQSYWYTDLKTRVYRTRCQRINEPDILAEYPTEAAQALGGVFSQKIFGDSRPLYRIEDYGHRKWVRTE